MHNPFLVIPLLFRARSPRRTADLKAVALPFWIRKGYDGLTFFGHIITHTQADADDFNSHPSAIKNHEMIHLYQARACHNSWLCFYWKYGCFWLQARRFRRQLKSTSQPSSLLDNTGYWLNPFELEAYIHMNDLHYLDHRTEATGWKDYATLPPAERLRLLRKRLSGNKS